MWHKAHKIKWSLYFVFLLLATGIQSEAQRLMPRQRSIQFKGGIPLLKGEVFEQANFSIGMDYLYYFSGKHYLSIGGKLVQTHYDYRSVRVPVQSYLASFGYSYRLLADRGRNLLVYIGASPLVGYEDINYGKTVLYDGAQLLNKSNCVYGGSVNLSIEVFVIDKLMFFVEGNAALLWGTELNIFRPTAMAGFRINL